MCDYVLFSYFGRALVSLVALIIWQLSYKKSHTEHFMTRATLIKFLSYVHFKWLKD